MCAPCMKKCLPFNAVPKYFQEKMYKKGGVFNLLLMSYVYLSKSA